MNCFFAKGVRALLTLTAPSGRTGHRRVTPITRLLMATTLLLSATATSAQNASNSLEDVSFAELPGDRVRVTLTMSGPVPTPSTFNTNNPARVVLDFGATRSNVQNRTTNVGIGPVRSITAVEAKGRTRVVVNLLAPVPYETKTEGNKLLLTLNAAGSGVFLSGRGAMQSAPRTRQHNTIESIDFRRGPAGEGRVLITMSKPSTMIDIREQGSKVMIDFLDSTLPQELVRRLDVTDFATPVQTVDAYPRGSNVVMEILPSGEYEYISYQTDELYTVEFKALTKRDKEQLQKKRFRYTGESLSLNFQDN